MFALADKVYIANKKFHAHSDQWRIHIVARLARATPFRRHAANSGDRRKSDYAVSVDA